MEVATGEAHPPGGLHHNNKIPPDYTRVEVHTVKPEFMQWTIDYATPEGLVLFGDVMGQFILWSCVVYPPLHELRLHSMHLDPSVVWRYLIIVV